jgi:hypothetical protein
MDAAQSAQEGDVDAIRYDSAPCHAHTRRRMRVRADAEESHRRLRHQCNEEVSGQ